MSDYSSLKATINANVKANNNHEITGSIMNSVLNAMVNSLGAGYQFMGVATPDNPGTDQTPDYNCFYLAATPGTYSHLGGLVVSQHEMCALVYNGTWSKQLTDLVSQLNGFPKLFDMTPDGTGYYSAGGVITPLASYRRKAINVTSYAGKILIVRAGYLNNGLQIGDYNFIKKSDNSYIRVIDAQVSVPQIDPSIAIAIRLPEDAVELELSWDYRQISVSAFVMDGSIYQYGGSISTIYCSSSNGQDFVGTPSPQPFGQLFNHKSFFVYLSTRPTGNVTLNISGTGAKPVYLIGDKGFEVMSEKTISESACFFPVFLDAGGNRYVVPKTLNKCADYPVTRFDMTPDGSGYYSAGGVVSPLASYRHKAFDVTGYAGKRLRIRVGYGRGKGSPTSFVQYSFVKLSDNSFVELKDCVVASPFENDSCADVVLPANAVELQCSWGCDFNPVSNPPFVYYDTAYNALVSLYQSGGDLQYISENIFHSFDMTPDGTGYYSAGGVISPLASYRRKAIDVSAYKGKTLRCVFGYPNVPAGWSWIKYDDDTYAPLASVGYRDGDEWVFVVPDNIAELEASWDVSPDSGIHPLLYFDADLQGQIDELRELIDKPLAGKTIFLFGDSISSADYTWYKDKLAEITGAVVLNQGASGRNAAYQASNAYFQRLANNPNDVVVVLVGGNDSGVSGSVGTFDANSPLGQMGESVVQETDISVDYNGSTFIQAISHIIRKWKSLYWNFRLNAGLTAHILDTQNGDAVVYPASGTATELECINYAASQGWTLGYGERYVMMTTETDESKQAKLSAVHQPKMFICTTLPQRRYNSGSYWSDPTNWERKRLACIECAEKYGMPLIDLAKEFAIDWDVEPYWPGQGYTGTSMTDNQGVYTMDGLHPNEFGYEYIAQIVAKHLVK